MVVRVLGLCYITKKPQPFFYLCLEEKKTTKPTIPPSNHPVPILWVSVICLAGFIGAFCELVLSGGEAAGLALPPLACWFAKLTFPWWVTAAGLCTER